MLEGIIIGGKAMREHFEAINHREAIQVLDKVERLMTFMGICGDEAVSLKFPVLGAECLWFTLSPRSSGSNKPI